VSERFVHDGAEPIGGTPDEFAAVIHADLKKWSRIIKDVGIRLDGAAS
jgi:tripartite-type tricarboxylate transporter receptor subunit TctC